LDKKEKRKRAYKRNYGQTHCDADKKDAGSRTCGQGIEDWETKKGKKNMENAEMLTPNPHDKKTSRKLLSLEKEKDRRRKSSNLGPKRDNAQKGQRVQKKRRKTKNVIESEGRVRK